MVCPIT